MPGTFSPQARVSDPDMHHGTCLTHVPWCMLRSLTSGFLYTRWRVKRPRHSRCMRNPRFCVSGKRPIMHPVNNQRTTKALHSCYLCFISSVITSIWGMFVRFSSGPFYQQGLTLIPEWTSNHIHHKIMESCLTWWYIYAKAENKIFVDIGKWYSISRESMYSTIHQEVLS